MRVIRKKTEIPAPGSSTRGLVPTMGAFHEGHLTLIRQARADCDEVAVSLFVNPTQFSPGEDYDRYPRDEERDFAMAESAGVDWIYAPSVDDVYAFDATRVHVKGLADLWEGRSRPGHFDGVATVVCKLFQRINPDLAYFGLKDYQQCRIVDTMVRDLDFGVKLKFMEAVREPDGLAMSSRNIYLTTAERTTAPALYAELCRAASAIRESVSDSREGVLQSLSEGRRSLESAGFQVEYFALVDSDTLAPLRSPKEGARLIAAVRLGRVRLIDNCAV